MKITSVSNSFPNSMVTRKKQNNQQAFKAHLYISNNVRPYLTAQAQYLALEKTPEIAQKWADETFGLIPKIGTRLKNLLNPDTPLVLDVSEEAMQSLINNKKFFNGLDGRLTLDGQTFLGLPEMTDIIRKYTTPIKFKFGPDESAIEQLEQTVNFIPKAVADYFKPW